MYLTPEFLPNYVNQPPLLIEVLTLNSAEAQHIQLKIRSYNSAMATVSEKDEFVARGSGQLKSNPTITVNRRLYLTIGTRRPPSGGLPRFAFVYINDTAQAALNQKHFYGVP